MKRPEQKLVLNPGQNARTEHMHVATFLDCVSLDQSDPITGKSRYTSQKYLLVTGVVMFSLMFNCHITNSHKTPA